MRLSFQQWLAVRIASISLALASVAVPISWFLAREAQESATVSLAIEESRRLLRSVRARDLIGPGSRAAAARAAETITGGLFDLVEIYDGNGRLLAEVRTPSGDASLGQLPEHAFVKSTSTSYESIELPGNLWVLRVFVPLHEASRPTSDVPIGYLEGVRIVPGWQRDHIRANSFLAALMVGLASLLCGAMLYPVLSRLFASRTRKIREVLDSHIFMMEALGRAIAKRDSDTGAHNFRVAWIAARIAEKLDVTGTDMRALIAGSFLHDVGKIGISDVILLKPGKLTREEMDIMRTHVAHGEQIVVGLGWLDGAKSIVAAHHEKWDGSGYPRGLKGEAIPLAARIFALADVFDALCSKRPYKAPMAFGEVMAILEQGAGSHFDPSILAVFRTISREIYDRLDGNSEDDDRLLMEDIVRRHFET